jgi:hypothetical protein
MPKYRTIRLLLESMMMPPSTVKITRPKNSPTPVLYFSGFAMTPAVTSNPMPAMMIDPTAASGPARSTPYGVLVSFQDRTARTAVMAKTASVMPPKIPPLVSFSARWLEAARKVMMPEMVKKARIAISMLLNLLI